MSKRFIKNRPKQLVENTDKLISYNWHLNANSNKIILIEGLVDKILNTGVMIHEKGFIKLMSENKYQITSIIKIKKG